MIKKLQDLNANGNLVNEKDSITNKMGVIKNINQLFNKLGQPDSNLEKR